MNKKILTFSYDDAVTQDIRFIKILDKYGLKATFNINSSLLGNKNDVNCFGKTVSHIKVNKEDVRSIYKNHEVAVHTLTHPNLTNLSEAEITEQVEGDRLCLSELVGYEVFGMAYPCGGVNNDDRVADIIKNNTSVKFSRTITSTYSFGLPENVYRLNPTIHHLKEPEKLNELAESFVNLEACEPALFYIWGHSYEFDANDTWCFFEKFCKKISGRKDILYLTNSEALKTLGCI